MHLNLIWCLVSLPCSNSLTLPVLWVSDVKLIVYLGWQTPYKARAHTYVRVQH